MSSTPPKTSYGSIFKTTFLFGFVQVFKILTKVILNKIVAILLGARGMGIIGLYHNSISLLVAFSGLGVSQSAVRDISEANGTGDENEISKIISVTNYVIVATSLLGVVLTIGLSPLLSKWQFGNSLYTRAFMWISIVVGLNIFAESQLAILKGMRQLRTLAKASVFGAFVGLIAAIPFYYFLGENGIIPSLIITSLASLFYSNYFVRKIKYSQYRFSFRELLQYSSPMVKMGIALMMVSFISAVFNLIVASFINRTGKLADVGIYNAGATIITGYFGVIITAMTTDYYPRISAVNNNNVILQEEMNRQAETGLILVFPLAVFFVFLAPLFIKFLYTPEFYGAINYTDFAIIGTIIVIVSNCMGMILLAKQASKIFIISVLLQRLLLLGIYLLSYSYLGLRGLGLSYLSLGLIHLLVMIGILNRFYKIRLERRVFLLLLMVVGITYLTVLVRKFELELIKYVFGVLVFLFASVFSYVYMKNRMGIILFDKLKDKFTKHE